MNLLDLPEEVLCEILKRLDTQTKLLLWNMCSKHAPHIRNLLRRQSVMHYVHLIGPSSVLQQRALLDLAPYIVELNLSGLRFLKFPSTIRVIRHFANLRELDLTYTRVGMLKACDLCEQCPKLKRLAVFFDWPDVMRTQTLPDDGLLHLVQRCQRAFSRLEDVRFLGDCYGMVQCYPLEILRLNDCVRSLRLDLIEDRYALYQHFECSVRVPPSLRTFDMRYMDRKLKNDNLLLHRIVKFFNLENWHYLLVEGGVTPLFHMSASLYTFAVQFLGNAQCNEITSALQHEVSHLYMWHSDLEKHNPQLLQKIIDMIRMHVPTLTCDMNESTNTVNVLNKSFVVHVFALPPGSLKSPDSSEPPSKRFCFAKRYFCLNLDHSLQMMRDARVSIVNENCHKCSLSSDHHTKLVLQLDPSSATVRNLSFLSITDCLLDASFTALWEICHNLQTLKLINTSSFRNTPIGFHDVMQMVHLSSSIKNLMYVDVNVDMKKLLNSMAQCPSLENVFWGNMEEPYNFKESEVEKSLKAGFNDFSRLVSCCHNLRSFTLNLHNLKNYRSDLRRAVNHQKRNVVVVTQSKYPYHKIQRYDPYFAVFEHFDADNIFSDMKFNFE